MKPIKFLTAGLAALCLVAAFLPFWNGVSMWDFLAMKSWQSYLIVGASGLALALSALAIQQRCMRRATALVVTACFGAVSLTVLSNFVPIFDSSPGAFEDLMESGDIGAKLLFFGAAAGLFLGAIGVVKAERRAEG